MAKPRTKQHGTNPRARKEIAEYLNRLTQSEKREMLRIRRALKAFIKKKYLTDLHEELARTNKRIEQYKRWIGEEKEYGSDQRRLEELYGQLGLLIKKSKNIGGWIEEAKGPPMETERKTEV